MRKALTLTLAVLLCALTACALCQSALNDAVDEAERLRVEALLAADREDYGRAGALLSRLAQHWRDRARLMELLADHDALHEVDAAIAEAAICLECRDHDDFLRTMSAIRLALEHLRDEQTLSWENLY